MAKPVIWTVDDDPDVLRAVERDLRRHYGDRSRVISADFGVSALDGSQHIGIIVHSPNNRFCHINRLPLW